MSEKHLRRVADIAHLVRRRVEVDPIETYQEIGIRSFGNGVFHKEPVLGVELGNKRVFWIQPGDLLLNNVFAWEGAIAVATEAELGMIGSHRFMTYVVDPEIADADYLRYFFLTERGLDLIGSASPGSAGRNRTLNISLFNDLEIALPPLVEQRAISHRISSLLAATRELKVLCDRSTEQRPLAVESAIQKFLRRTKHDVVLSAIAEINPRPAQLSAETPVAFVPMAAVDAVTGKITTPEERLAFDVGKGYKQFRKGDVIFARITPSMQNGKSAIADIDTDYGYGSTEFHVVRPGPDVLPSWIHTVVRTLSFREGATKHFTGTAGQQRVPTQYLKDVRIPLPASKGEQQRVLEDIESLLAISHEAEKQQESRRARADALASSILNHSFSCQD